MKNKVFSFLVLDMFLVFFFLQSIISFPSFVFAETGKNLIVTGGKNLNTEQNITRKQTDNQIVSGALKDAKGVGLQTLSRQSGQLIDTRMANIKRSSNQIKSLPHLLISEVYFDGKDERIEIKNIGTEKFSGDLKIIGAKADPIVIKSVNIPTGENVLIGDTFSMLQSQDKVIKDNIGLNIYDTQKINIQLEYSGIQLDVFLADKTIVEQANKIKKTSLHRFFDTKEIRITSGDYINNVHTGFVANPGKVRGSTESGNNAGSGGLTTGGTTMTGILPSPHLLLSERYVYEKPYIEITNLSETEIFSGIIMISGNIIQNISQNIILQPQKQYIFYTDASMFENILQYSGTQTTSLVPQGPHIGTLGNTGLQLQLFYSGNLLDNFTVHNDWVKKLSGDMTSFEKIGSGTDTENYITTYIGLNLDRVYNIKNPYLGNPGKLFMVAENSKDITQSISENFISTTGVKIPIKCNDFWNSNQLKISEIFPGNNIYHPFVELENPGNITENYDYILLSGTALSGSLYYQTRDIEHNKMILLTDTESRYNEGLDALANPDFSLNNSGRIALYGVNFDATTLDPIDQDILDVVYFSGFTPNKSLYYNAHDIQCGRIFDEVANFSPTFDDRLLPFFSVQSTPVVKTVYVNRGRSCNYEKQTRFDPAPEQSADPVEIKTIKYHSPEFQQITLKAKFDKKNKKNNYDINLRNYRIQTLNPLKYYPLKSRTLFVGQDKVMTGNFYLPKQDSCVNLLKDDVVVDRYCYARLSTLKTENMGNSEDVGIQDNTEKQQEETDNISNIKNNQNTFMRYLTITNIDYNPQGTDTNNEKLYFAQNISELFSEEYGRKISDFSLDVYKNNQLYKTKKFTKNTIIQHGKYYLQGNFQLPNNNPSQQDIIVNLRYHQQVIARKKYNPYKDKHTFSAGKYFVSSVLDGDTFRIKNNGKTQSVRLLGVDAPESSIVRFGKAECFGRDAKKHLKMLVDKKTVRLEPDTTTNSRDKFGRRLAYVYLGDTSERNFINRDLLIGGYAKEYTYQKGYYKYQSNFKKLMQVAKSRKIGMWSDNCLKQEKEKKEEQSKEQQEGKIEEKEFFPEKYDITIQHINYNPKGKDYNRETITLLANSSIKLNKNFHLLVNTHKKKIPKFKNTDVEDGILGSLVANEYLTITGNFQFPNTKPTCVKLQYQDYIFDTYCYNPNDDKDEEQNKNQDQKSGTGLVVTGGSNVMLEDLSLENLAIFQITRLKRFNDKTCLLYQNQKITCINTPKIKHRSSKKVKIKYKTIMPEAVQKMERELAYHKKFVQVLKGYLQDKRYPFYNRELKVYFAQLKNDKIHDIVTLKDYFKTSKNSFLDTRIQKNILKNIQKSIPNERKQKYQELSKKYMEELNNKANEV